MKVEEHLEGVCDQHSFLVDEGPPFGARPPIGFVTLAFENWRLGFFGLHRINSALGFSLGSNKHSSTAVDHLVPVPLPAGVTAY